MQINNAGTQSIQGRQIYNGTIVQQFTLRKDVESRVSNRSALVRLLDFYVPTFECSQPPVLNFDYLSSTKAYLSSFHFRIVPERCQLRQFTCQLELTRIDYNESTVLNTTFHRNQTVSVAIDQSFTQAIRRRHSIDDISDEVAAFE